MSKKHQVFRAPFRRVLLQISFNIKFRMVQREKEKGSYPTCEVSNSCNELLQRSRIRTSTDIDRVFELIRRWLRLRRAQNTIAIRNEAEVCIFLFSEGFIHLFIT